MASARWMFEDWPEKSIQRQCQIVDTGSLRLFVIMIMALHLPQLLTWLSRKLDRV